MMHSIRLYRAWQLTPLCWRSEAGNPLVEDRRLPESREVHVDACWSKWLGDFVGTARYSRVFHRPTNLRVGDQVLLELGGFSGRAHVRVNEVDYGLFDEKDAPVQIDLKDNLAQENRVVIDVSDGLQTQGLTGMVYVKIRSGKHPP